jgi:hypothetical protein
MMHGTINVNIETLFAMSMFGKRMSGIKRLARNRVMMWVLQKVIFWGQPLRLESRMLLASNPVEYIRTSKGLDKRGAHILSFCLQLKVKLPFSTRRTDKRKRSIALLIRSVDGIATHYMLDGPGIECRWARDYPNLSRPSLVPTHPSLRCRSRGKCGGKAAVSWRWPPTPSSAEVKERVELYLYSPSGPWWPVLGWTLPYLCFTHSEPRH